MIMNTIKQALLLVVLFPVLASAELRGQSSKTTTNDERRLDTTFQMDVPTPSPVAMTPAPTSPTRSPTNRPTRVPTRAPTPGPTPLPTTGAPTLSPAPSTSPVSLPPLCSSLSIVPNDADLDADEEYSGYSFDANTQSGDCFSKSIMSGRYWFAVSKTCEYKVRHFDTWQTYSLRGPNEWFQAVAKILNGRQVENGAYFTGYDSPKSNGNDFIISETDDFGCAVNKFCVGITADCKAVGDGPIIYEFDTADERNTMKWLLNEAVKDGDRSKIFGTNTYLACGQPPFCYGPGAKGVNGRWGPGGTCYADPIYLGTDSCDKHEFRIEYTNGSPAYSTRDVFPWFDECCKTFECVRREAFDAAAARFNYDEPSTSVGSNSDGTWWFKLSNRGIQGQPIYWDCPTEVSAKNLRDYAEKVKQANLLYQEGDADCTKDPLPPILEVPPATPPTPDPVGPDCSDIESNLGLCKQSETGTCYIQAASEGKCSELEYVMEGAVGTEVAIYDDLLQWFGACVVAYSCSMMEAEGYTPGELTYVDNPNFSSYVKNGVWYFEFKHRNSGGEPTLEGEKIQYVCDKEGAFNAMEFAYALADYNGWGNTYGGPNGGTSNGYDLFKMAPVECTVPPSMSPTLSPTDTLGPSFSPSMAPTVCAESYLNAQALNIALVVDLSFSTYAENFAGTSIGDVNGDGKKNTILDAEIKAVDELLNAIAEEGVLDNGNSEVGLISFHTSAKFEGTFGTVGTEAERLMDHLKNECRTKTDENNIMHTNNGFTNFDAALDRAVEYFTNLPANKQNRLNLLVFLSDGIPNVRGDGDDEGYCTEIVTFWNDNATGTTYACADAEEGLMPGDEFTWCLANDADCSLNNAYQDCVRGPRHCEDETELALKAVANYASEIAALEAMGVERLAIGVGRKSNVESGSALWMIDNNPGKEMGVLPLKVMSTDELSQAVSTLCILNTDPPTPQPSASPSGSPTVSPAPSIQPTGMPSASPSTLPTITKTGSPTQAPVTAWPTQLPSTLPTSSPSLQPTSGPTSSPTVAPSANSSASPTLSPAPTHELPDCYEGTQLIHKDSNDVAIYNDSMVEILSMNTQTVDIKINNIWLGSSPDSVMIFEHNDSADTLIGNGFSCSNPNGAEIVLDSISGEDTINVQCYALHGEEGSITMLAVIDVLIGDPDICATNSVTSPCDSAMEIEEACKWRLVIPCAKEAMCTDEPSYSPTATPSASPSMTPTVIPTAPPSATPTVSPSAKPSEYIEPDVEIEETEEEEVPIIPVGPPECPEDEFLVFHQGVTSLPSGSVEIISQDTTTVTVALSQKWSLTEVDFIYYQYKEDVWSNKCYAEQTVDFEWSEEITISCTHHSQMGELEIWVKDDGPGVLMDEDNAIIPKCCYPEEDSKSVVSYVLEISCVPKCPTISRRNLLSAVKPFV